MPTDADILRRITGWVSPTDRANLARVADELERLTAPPQPGGFPRCAWNCAPCERPATTSYANTYFCAIHNPQVDPAVVVRMRAPAKIERGWK